MPERLEIPGKSDDARAKRAREQIAWALVALIVEKEYESISVQDIAERAQVGRTTFYAHFEDKEDVLVRHNIVFGQHLGRLLTWDASAAQFRFPVAKLFEHARSSRSYYDALVRARRMDDLLKILRINMAEGFEKCITAARTESNGTPASLLAQHFAASIVSLLVWWMDRHYPLDPKKMEEHFHRLIANVR